MQAKPPLAGHANLVAEVWGWGCSGFREADEESIMCIEVQQ